MKTFSFLCHPERKRRMTRSVVLGTALPFLFLNLSAQAGSLDLESYLREVQNTNPAFRASDLATQGTRLRLYEGDLLTLPQFSLTYQTTSDEKPSTNTASSGTKTLSDQIVASVSEQTTFGTSFKFSYTLYHRNTSGASSQYVPVSEYYTGSPSVEINHPLLRNDFGSETRATQDALLFASQAAHYQERFNQSALLIEAKNTFLKLYYTRQSISALKESVELAEKLRNWVKKQANQNLVDQSDFLQSQSGLELRELELVKTENDEKNLARAFNSLRNLESDQVTEILKQPALPEIKKNNYSPSLQRDDMRVLETKLKANRASSEVSKQKNKPSLDLFATYAWNGLDTTSSVAIDESLKSDQPTLTVGVKFSTPLALGTASHIREGFAKEVLSAELNLKRKKQEQIRDFESLQNNIENSVLRLKLARTLEASQKLKLESERKRHQRGRTTLFQVLQYEQEYVTARLNTIKTELETQSLINELQLYRGDTL